MNIITIKKRAEFLQIGKKNTKFYSKSTLILAFKTPEKYFSNSQVRVGYTVTKKIGNAVIRNKCKRRYREVFKELAPAYAKENYDYVILARSEILKSDFKKIRSDLKFCLNGINKLMKNDKRESK